jgi:protein-tyrosine phosphatase
MKEVAANIIDTHSHLLPQVDHGSPDMETTLRMIRAAADQGTTTIACTPHLYELDPQLVERVRQVYGEVTAAVKEAAIPVRLLLGFEVDLMVAATCDLETIRTLCIQSSDGAGGVEASPVPGRAGEPASVNGAAVIIETPFSNWPPFFEETIYRLSTGGILPILAHPERNERVQRSPDALTGCLNAGAILQGTSGSFSAMFRKESHKTFYELLARGWFGLLASDGHSEPEYTWSLAPLLAELGDRISPEERDLLVNVNPARVLDAKRPIPMVPKRPQGKSRRRFL